MRQSLTVALLLCLAACGRSGSAPEGEGSGSGATPAPLDEKTLLASERPPVVVAEAQTCSADADCRVYQPADWSAEVECCYAYGCDLRYEAVNQANWELLKRWRKAHAFDCVDHLRKSGPCATTSPVCGLSQEPPAAVCASGVCKVAVPEAWPKVDGAAQRCDVDSDCRAIPEPVSTVERRCCGGGCAGPWVAVTRATQEEIAAWQAEQKPACDAAPACSKEAPCAAVPAAICTGGVCGLAPSP